METQIRRNLVNMNLKSRASNQPQIKSKTKFETDSVKSEIDQLDKFDSKVNEINSVLIGHEKFIAEKDKLFHACHSV